MIWTLLPFGLIAILVAAMLLAGSMVDKLIRISREGRRGEETKENCLRQALAIVDQHGAVRTLSREEFEGMKKLNPKLMEMKACGMVYLTEVPEITQLPPLATPKLYQ